MTTADELMTRFVERTGVTGTARPRRYLWTDAFAVCNLLALGKADLARTLIERVHRELGRHRSDDTRGGWISGLSEQDGEAHPTLGGLRIGKPLPERRPDERVDERLEWDRDGQYFHYLTKWMHALDQAARILVEPQLATWARELADAAHRRFVYDARGRLRMYWKMSTDLMRPLVASMGHHDPLDGYVTCLQLRATGGRGSDLDRAVADFRAMLAPDELATTDPLGIGGLLFDACRLAQLDRDDELRESIVSAVRQGLARYIEQRDLARPADQRLAFRELGLAIGLSAVERIGGGLAQFLRVREAIVAFWADPVHRGGVTYRAHQDINDVMLATSLSPDGFLVLGPALP